MIKKDDSRLHLCAYAHGCECVHITNDGSRYSAIVEHRAPSTKCRLCGLSFGLPIISVEYNYKLCVLNHLSITVREWMSLLFFLISHTVKPILISKCYFTEKCANRSKIFAAVFLKNEKKKWKEKTQWNAEKRIKINI